MTDQTTQEKIQTFLYHSGEPRLVLPNTTQHDLESLIELAKAEGLQRGREAGRTEALELIADEEGWEESREYYRKLLTPSEGADTKGKL